MENLIGRIIENYRFESIIGKGGMGVVYRGYDLKLDRPVAIKIMNVQIADVQRFVERFRREAKNQAKLIHPNIVTVYGFIEDEGILGIVMEYVEGEGLDRLIRRQGRLHPYDAVYVTKQILSGIGYAHSKGFIHRDIKPSNIIINKEGIAKIMDFGISKSFFEKGVTKTGAKVGTVYYMSPEQIRGERVTHHADIYAIGCTFYEMLTGKPPFFYDSEYEIMEAHLKKNPPKISRIIPQTPDLIDKIIARATSKNPSERYAHCEEFLNDIEKLEKELAVLHSKYAKKKKIGNVPKKTTSIIAFASFIFAFLLLSWFVYKQVDDLLKHKRLDFLKKYSIETLFKSSDYFKGFKLVAKKKLPINAKINSIKMLDRSLGIAVADSGYVLKTTDNGLSWKQIARFDSLNLHDVWLKPNGEIIIASDSSKLFYGKISSNSFSVIKLPENFALIKIKFINERVGFILGSQGLILKSVNGGNSWKSVPAYVSSLLYDLDFSTENVGFVVGQHGTLLKTTDQGETWHRVKSYTNKYLRSIIFLNNKNGIIVGGGGTILRTDDGGESWVKTQFKNVRGLNKIIKFKDNMLLIVANKGYILVSENRGQDWKLYDTHSFINLINATVNVEGKIFISGIFGNIVVIK